MAIVITKKKVEAPVAPPVEKKVHIGLPEAPPLLDEIGEIQALIEAIQNEINAREADAIAELAVLKKKLGEKMPELLGELNETYADKGDDKKFVLKGEKYQAEIGAKTSSRTVADIKTIASLLTSQDEELFWKVAKINLKDVDAYLTPEEVEACVDKTRGDRKVVICPKV